MCDYNIITNFINTTKQLLTEHIHKSKLYIYFNEHGAEDNNEKKQFIAKLEYKEQSKNYYKKNKDKFKKYYIDNKDKILEQQRQYKAYIKELRTEQSQNYYIDNRNKILEQYKANIKELKTEQSKNNYIDNRDKILELQKQYKAKQKKTILSKQ